MTRIAKESAMVQHITCSRRLRYLFAWLALSTIFGIARTGVAAPPERLRIIVETDAGGDPDDEQSLVRFLLYANEWDVEGIVANRPVTLRPENRNRRGSGLEIVREFVEAYASVFPRLKEHEDRFPEPAVLRTRTVPGYDDTDDGVRLVMAAVDRDDPRPVWFLNWGTNQGSGVSSLKRALDKVLAERGREGYAKFKNKIRLSSADKFGEHTTTIEPLWRLWTFPFYPDREGGRWYHRFGPLTATAGGFDLERDVRTNHGPLGALYPTNTHLPQKEGDTYTFLYLVPTGMNDPLHPEWGSWAGRFGVREDWKPANANYYWANQQDAWNGTTNRDNMLKRWAADLQNDFRARLDWCVKPVREANHPPQVVINGDMTGQILSRELAAGSTVNLSAAGSSDPDGNELEYQWSVYPEAGTYPGKVELANAAASGIGFRIPDDAAGKTIHVLLTVRDRGEPPLARYRRVVLNVIEKQAIEEADSRAPGGRVLHVAADGSAPYRTIQAAIDAAPAGAVIRVAPGTYDEPLQIRQPATLEGAGWKETKLTYHWFGLDELGKTGFAVPPESRERFDELMKKLKATDGDAYAEALATLVKEFGPKRTLTISHAGGVVVRGLQVSMSGKVSSAGLMGTPMLLIENSGVSVEDCAFAGSPVEGLQVKGESKVTFQRCLVAGIRGSGFVVEASSKGRVRISDCEIRNCGYAGAQIKGPGEVVVENCRISGAEFHGIRYDDASPTLMGNAFFNINRGAIYADGKTRATIRDNLFLGCSIGAMGRNRDVIEHNTFLNLRPRPKAAWTNEAAISISGAAEPTVHRNVLSRYEHGVAQPPGKVPGAAISNNVFDTIGTPVVRWLAGKNPKTRYEDEPLPSGNGAGQVKFTDPDRDDFRLAAEQDFPDRDVGARRFAPPQPAWPEIAEERDLLERLAAQ